MSEGRILAADRPATAKRASRVRSPVFTNHQ
jgi:hypothetical protein